jgi:D-beta-D-heptose 7-phosphate kinase / D-beta-D-heptose 1-phosphate adenosyltransferase
MFLARSALVVGDVMLDLQVDGLVSRITPDAPVPVVRIKSELARPGGAANVAAKLGAFGIEVTLVSAIGRDDRGRQLVSLLRPLGVNVVRASSFYPTITKMSIFGLSSGGERQKILRLDYEEFGDSSEKTINEVINLVEGKDLIIISDYQKGFCSVELCRAVILEANRRDIPVFVDSKDSDWYKFKNATLIKPNLTEFFNVLKEDPTDDLSFLEAKAFSLIDKFSLKGVLLSRDKQGLNLYKSPELFKNEEEKVINVAATTKNVVDVSCAGDSVLAAFSAAYISGFPLKQCVELGNTAGALAVERQGAEPISLGELELRYSNQSLVSKTVPKDSLNNLINGLKKCGKRLVFTNGCFDTLHRGHIHHLREAKELGDVLIVGLNSDDSVRRIKGEGRPITNLEDRLSILSALSFVDYLIVFSEDTPINLIKSIKPNILVKGANTLEILGEEYAEKTVILPLLDDHSSRVVLSSSNQGGLS